MFVHSAPLGAMECLVKMTLSDRLHLFKSPCLLVWAIGEVRGGDFCVTCIGTQGGILNSKVFQNRLRTSRQLTRPAGNTIRVLSPIKVTTATQVDARASGSHSILGRGNTYMTRTSPSSRRLILRSSWSLVTSSSMVPSPSGSVVMGHQQAGNLVDGTLAERRLNLNSTHRQISITIPAHTDSSSPPAAWLRVLMHPPTSVGIPYSRTLAAQRPF